MSRWYNQDSELILDPTGATARSHGCPEHGIQVPSGEQGQSIYSRAYQRGIGADYYDGDKYNKHSEHYWNAHRYKHYRGQFHSAYFCGYVPWPICYFIVLILSVGIVAFFTISIGIGVDVQTIDSSRTTDSARVDGTLPHLNATTQEKEQQQGKDTQIAQRTLPLPIDTCPAGQTMHRGQCARMLYHPDPLDKSMMHNTTNPCDDFYTFACGQYAADERNVGSDATFSYLYKQNMERISNIVTRAPKDSKLEMFYTTCLSNEGNSVAVGRGTIGKLLKRVDVGFNSTGDSGNNFARVLGELWRHDVMMPFRFSMELDPANARRAVPTFVRAGVSDARHNVGTLPHKRAVQSRLQNVMSVEEAVVAAELVVDIEVRLLAAWPPREQEATNLMQYAEQMRKSRRNVLSYQRFTELMYPFDVDEFIRAFVGEERYEKEHWHLDPREDVWVFTEGYFQALGRLFSQLPLESWKAYMRHAVLYSVIDLTPDAQPELFYTYHHGYDPEHSLPWKRPPRFVAFDRLAWDRRTRCAQISLAYLPIVIDNYFTSESGVDVRQRGQVRRLAESIRDELASFLRSRGRNYAAEKVAAIEIMAGTPNNWPINRSDLMIGRTSHVDNILSIRYYHQQLMMDTMYPGKILSADDMFDGPLYVANAYYQHQLNAIMINAGILSPPAFTNLYDRTSQAARIGVFIGHELVHSIDIMGTYFDKDGSFHPWMSDDNENEYLRRAGCVMQLYNGKTRYGNDHNGEATVNENIADILGFQTSYNSIFTDSSLTDAQKRQFFIVYAQTWCQATTPQNERDFISYSVHSTPEFRVNNVVMQHNDFADLFQCPQDSVARNTPTCTLF